MNFYKDMDALKMHIENEIKTSETLIADLKNIIPAVKLFDGKCYNKRVIEEARKHCSACTLYAANAGNHELASWRLQLLNRGYKSSTSGCWNYPDRDTAYISILGDKENRRIDVTATIAAIENHISDLKTNIAAMKAFDVDASYSQFVVLLGQIDAYNKTLPDVARDTLCVRRRW